MSAKLSIDRSYWVWSLLYAAVAVGMAPALVHAQLTILNHWGGYGTAFNQPTGVGVSPSGSVYVADPNNNRVQVFDSMGDYQNALPGSSGVSFNSPSGVSVDSNGNVYVADTFNDRIVMFDAGDVYKRAFGSYGDLLGELINPFSLTTYTSGGTTDIYVADSGNNRIEEFSPSGSYLGTIGNGHTTDPTGVAIDSTGTIYVAGNLDPDHQIDVFSLNGSIETPLGGSEGKGNAQFSNPSGVAVSLTGSLYVVDNGNSRLQVLNPATGDVDYALNNGQFLRPDGVAVAPTGMVYVADTGNNRVVRLFDPSAWVSGTDTFTNMSTGPTSLAVGPNEILGTTLSLKSTMGLTVGNTLTIDAAGSLTQVQTGTSLSTAILNISGSFTYDSGTFSATTIIVNQGGTFHASNSTNDILSANVTNSGALTIDTGASITFGSSYTGSSGTITNNGSLDFDSSATASNISGSGSLTVGMPGGASGNLQLAASSGAIQQSSITLTSGSKLDLTTNTMDINYSGSSPAATIRAELASGYDHGAWDGTGIYSSVAANNTKHSTTLGYVDTGTQVQVKYTWVGDANLDGLVNATDLTMMAPGGTTNATWARGDFNYDGIVNADDYALFQLGSAYGSANISTTFPEPSFLSLLAAAILVSRRSLR